MRVGDSTVGTSTNCSADCGSGIGEREGHDEQEILGTSITCSAIGRSRICKASVTLSTVCGTEDRGSARRAAPAAHVAPAAHPDRVAGNRPGGEVLPGLRRVLAPVPLSPGPVLPLSLLRSGACTRTGPLAPTASRGEPTVAVGAPSCGGPRPRRQVRGRSWQPLETQTKETRPTHWCCG